MILKGPIFMCGAQGGQAGRVEALRACSKHLHLHSHLDGSQVNFKEITYFSTQR